VVNYQLSCGLHDNPNSTEIQIDVQNIDHLGIIAGIIDEIGIV
jgi:hypothetical protein